MSEEVKILIISGFVGAICAPTLFWIFSKMNIGKKETREEIEERNFGKK